MYSEQGYLALLRENYDLPETFEIEGEVFKKKNEFHVSLLCVKNILKIKPEIEEEILKSFCEFIQINEIKFEDFTEEFRLAKDGERKSVVAMCHVSNLDKFNDYLSEKIGLKIPKQPTHITIYTLEPNVGVGLNSQEELEQKSKKIEVPAEILARMMGYKKIIVVDENDKEIGAEYLMDAIKKKSILRVSRIYIFNESGKLLVQQRSKKVLLPLMLDESSSGHVDEDETYEEAAYRELKEELGLSDVKLELIEASFLTDINYNTVYRLIIKDDLKIKFDPREVENIFWYDINHLNMEMRSNPEKFHPRLIQIWGLLQGKLTKGINS